MIINKERIFMFITPKYDKPPRNLPINRQTTVICLAHSYRTILGSPICTYMYHGHLTKPPPFPIFPINQQHSKKSPSQKTKLWMTDLIPTKRLQEREEDNHDSCQKCVCARFHNCRICLTWLELSSWHCMQISKFMSHFITEN